MQEAQYRLMRNQRADPNNSNSNSSRFFVEGSALVPFQP
jgi:hypothetical protein